MKPLVSVIMPFLNQERYLADAVDSVRAQTMREWELLLVDDGSQDNSLRIAAAYVKSDTIRIKLLQQRDGRNRGAAAARNLGLKHAVGEFIGFLDADDVYEPQKLEAETGLLKDRPEVAMLYGPTIWWNPASDVQYRTEKLGIVPGRTYLPPKLLTDLLLLHKGDIPCICSAMIRRDAVLAVGGFEEDFKLYEDQTLWAKLFLRYPVFVSSRAVSKYRQHGESTSAKAQLAGEYHPWRLHAAELKFFDWLRSYIRSIGVSDPVVEKALNNASSPYHNRIAAARRLFRYAAFVATSEARWYPRAVLMRLKAMKWIVSGR